MGRLQRGPLEKPSSAGEEGAKPEPTPVCLNVSDFQIWGALGGFPGTHFQEQQGEDGMMQSRDTTRGVQGARITWEGVFPLKLDTNSCISLWMDCAPGCHTRTEVTSCPAGRGFPAGDHGVLQGTSMEALGCWGGVAVLGELQAHPGTLRCCSWKWR